MSTGNKKIALKSKITRNKDVFYNQLDKEIVFLLSVENSEYYGADEIGTIIWKKIEDPIVVEEIISQLLNDFNIDYESCKTDVLEFLNELNQKKLIIALT